MHEYDSATFLETNSPDFLTFEDFEISGDLTIPFLLSDIGIGEIFLISFNDQPIFLQLLDDFYTDELYYATVVFPEEFLGLTGSLKIQLLGASQQKTRLASLESTTSAVPLPGAASFMLTGLAGLAARKRLARA